jgi:hypothetical protein
MENLKMAIKVGDTVVMKSSVIKHGGDFAKNFKGVVVKMFGATCDVETLSGIRAVPVANLAAIREVYDYRTERASKIILDLQ